MREIDGGGSERMKDEGERGRDREKGTESQRERENMEWNKSEEQEGKKD